MRTKQMWRVGSTIADERWSSLCIPVLVTEIPKEALPVPGFEVEQRVRNEKSGVVTETDGPPFWSEKYQCWKVPTRCGRTWPCAHVHPYPSTVTKTIRVTGSEDDDEKIRTWLDCAPKGVSVEVEPAP